MYPPNLSVFNIDRFTVIFRLRIFLNSLPFFRARYDYLQTDLEYHIPNLYLLTIIATCDFISLLKVL